MANINIGNPFKRTLNGETLHIATVDDIAYSTKTEGSGVYAYDAIDVSLKDKLNEIEDKVILSENISEVVESINTSVNLVNTAKLITELAKDLALSYKNAAETAVSLIESVKNDLDTVKELANTFSTGFDADATFAIVSENEYNETNKNDLRDNCIYFCYK